MDVTVRNRKCEEWMAAAWLLCVPMWICCTFLLMWLLLLLWLPSSSSSSLKSWTTSANIKMHRDALDSTTHLLLLVNKPHNIRTCKHMREHTKPSCCVRTQKICEHKEESCMCTERMRWCTREMLFRFFDDDAAMCWTIFTRSIYSTCGIGACCVRGMSEGRETQKTTRTSSLGNVFVFVFCACKVYCAL